MFFGTFMTVVGGYRPGLDFVLVTKVPLEAQALVSGAPATNAR
jgi:hypothetical protein